MIKTLKISKMYRNKKLQNKVLPFKLLEENKENNTVKVLQGGKAKRFDRLYVMKECEEV